MAYVTSGQVGAQLDAGVVPDGLVVPSAPFALGQVVDGTNGSSWIYLKAAEAITPAGSYVTFDEGNTAYEGTKTLVDAGHRIAVAQRAFLINEYGWFQLTGPCLLYGTANCAADTTLYTTATAGLVDATSTSQTLLGGVVFTTAVGGSNAAQAALIGPSGIFVPVAI